MSRINDINIEIQRLKEEREFILNTAKGLDEASIKSLEWTVGCSATLQICSMGAAGLPTYKVIVSGPNVPHSSIKGIQILGDSLYYEQNLMFGNGFSNDYPYFYTNNHELLIEFLKTTKFKNLSYPESWLAVLEVARSVQ